MKDQIVRIKSLLTAWRIFVIKKLQGDRIYRVSDAMNFPVPTGWLTAIKELEKSQRELLMDSNNSPTAN